LSIFFAQISYQVAIELSYPVPEGISSNIQVLSLQLFGMIFIIIMSALENPNTHQMTAAVWLVTASVCLSAIAMLFYRGKHKRMLVDLKEETLLQSDVR